MIDRIHPELRPLVPALPQVDIAEPAAFRERQRIRAAELAAAVRRPQGMTVVDRLVPGPAGAPDVPVRIYTPGGSSSEVGALVWFHGGGYVFGEIEASERACVEIADVVGCVVVSVEYRLAPEHPYPAGHDDCCAALTWVAAHGDELGVDPARLAVGGVSAGAGLAAALALRATPATWDTTAAQEVTAYAGGVAGVLAVSAAAFAVLLLVRQSTARPDARPVRR